MRKFFEFTLVELDDAASGMPSRHVLIDVADIECVVQANIPLALMLYTKGSVNKYPVWGNYTQVRSAIEASILDGETSSPITAIKKPQVIQIQKPTHAENN